MKLSTLTDPTADVFKNAGAFVSDLVTPTVRLGVTGLSRSGKTVFITALVRNLVTGGRLPFFAPQAEGRIVRAYLEPQPDDDVPRFSYEEHLQHLAADPPTWPEGTRRISQLRLTIEYDSAATLRRAMGLLTGGALGPSKLHVDIVDYPGEWLVDLGLMDLDFGQWSARAIEQAEAPLRAKAAAPFLKFLSDGATAGDEQTAIEGAKIFTRYLEAARAEEPALSVLTPGRFLMPGDLAGSPLLTFFPLRAGAANTKLATLLARRYDSYKHHVVRPFFRDHFARIDRQIVLIDALAALNHGKAGIDDLAGAMDTVLAVFRPGANSWGSRMFARRIDRIVFAATKADHLNQQGHDRLEALLAGLVEGAKERAAAKGADVRVLAMAALRATREAEATVGGEKLPCIIGTPLAGEHVGDVRFDGKTETALFPGDLPESFAAITTRAASDAADIRALRFRPPRIVLETGGGMTPALPHIRLDRALQFLIGDRLA